MPSTPYLTAHVRTRSTPLFYTFLAWTLLAQQSAATECQLPTTKSTLAKVAGATFAPVLGYDACPDDKVGGVPVIAAGSSCGLKCTAHTSSNFYFNCPADTSDGFATLHWENGTLFEPLYLLNYFCAGPDPHPYCTPGQSTAVQVYNGTAFHTECLCYSQYNGPTCAAFTTATACVAPAASNMSYTGQQVIQGGTSGGLIDPLAETVNITIEAPQVCRHSESPVESAQALMMSHY